MNEEFTRCDCCGQKINAAQICMIADKFFCSHCYEKETFRCECCGERVLLKDRVSDGHIQICGKCYDDSYNRCTDCDRLIHSDNTHWYDDDPYCEGCFPCEEEFTFIHDYSYKPSPKFKKCSSEDFKTVRYYGVELEIDNGGKNDDNAENILYTANGSAYKETNIYIKSDGSLNDGMELVSQPCSIKYHKELFYWDKILQCARDCHYVSHNTKTCGLHVHIGRAELGDTVEQQEEVISRIMFFFESHWNEMVKFSRRTEEQLARWASRYGYKDKPKEILDDAKDKGKIRYRCVNIAPQNTVEIRIFRGTLKLNTFMAILEMVDSICENAVNLTDEEIHMQSWNDFAENINPEYVELIQYLKERQLYINEPVSVEEEI